jgi:hypothetical protein
VADHNEFRGAAYDPKLDAARHRVDGLQVNSERSSGRGADSAKQKGGF